jgi:hypothetical protein
MSTTTDCSLFGGVRNDAAATKTIASVYSDRLRPRASDELRDQPMSARIAQCLCGPCQPSVVPSLGHAAAT